MRPAEEEAAFADRRARRARGLRIAVAAIAGLLAAQALLALAVPPGRERLPEPLGALRLALWGRRLPAGDANRGYEALLVENTHPRFRDSYLAALAARRLGGDEWSETPVLISADVGLYTKVFERIAGPARVLDAAAMPAPAVGAPRELPGTGTVLVTLAEDGSRLVLPADGASR